VIEADSHISADGSSPHHARKQIILQDSLTFFVLLLGTVALYAVTSLLFSSFALRRQELAHSYATRGEAALANHQPEQAVNALRTAISYAPDEPANHLLLAEALAQAHHTEEATNYFLSLRDAQPADGFVNLQLARLAREKKNSAQAIEYYRSAALGNWTNDGVEQRRQVQLELCDYLIQLGEINSARAVVLMAAANSPDTAPFDTTFGDKLLATSDPADALSYYRKAIKADPHDFEALAKAGRLEYSLSDFAAARTLLELAVKQSPDTSDGREQAAQLKALSAQSEDILRLSMSRNLPLRDRADHILATTPIARHRFESCKTQFDTQVLPPALQALVPRWQTAARDISRHFLLSDEANQDETVQLLYDTETQTAQLCGAPAGDDAVLLMFATHQQTQVPSQERR
jgi:tetratricopeptide (TPR) repeat protein